MILTSFIRLREMRWICTQKGLNLKDNSSREELWAHCRRTIICPLMDHGHASITLSLSLRHSKVHSNKFCSRYDTYNLNSKPHTESRIASVALKLMVLFEIILSISVKSLNKNIWVSLMVKSRTSIKV